MGLHQSQAPLHDLRVHSPRELPAPVALKPQVSGLLLVRAPPGGQVSGRAGDKLHVKARMAKLARILKLRARSRITQLVDHIALLLLLRHDALVPLDRKHVIALIKANTVDCAAIARVLVLAVATDLL